MASGSSSAAGLTTRSTALSAPTGCCPTRACSAIPNGAAGNPAGAGGVALSKDGKTLYVAAAFGHSLARFDAESGAFRDEVALEAGSYPYGLVLDETHKRLYVSLWSKSHGGCRQYRELPSIGQWPTEEHPNEMLLAHEGKILFVANANRNTVTVIDTEAGKAIETIGTAIDPKAPARKHAQLAGALTRRIVALRFQCQHQQSRRRQCEGPRRKRTPGLHSGRLVPDLGKVVA